MKRQALKRILNSSLGRRLFIAIVLFSSVITLVITIFQIHEDYKNELTTIDLQFDQINKTSQQSLTQSIWVVDEVQIKKQLEGILQFSYVDYAAIYSDGEIKWSAGKERVSNKVSSRMPLKYLHRGEAITIAEIEIQGSLNEVYYRLLSKVFFILISNTLKTALVAIFVLFLFYHLLGRHIIQLAYFADNLGKKDKLTTFELDRVKIPGRKNDELDMLSNSFNGMIVSLREREGDLRVFQTAVEQSPNAILLTDPEGKIEYVNRQFTEVSGYSFDEVKGKSPSILTAGNTPGELYSELWQTVTSGGVWSGELKNKTRKGSVYWVSAYIAPILDKDGTILHYLAIEEDITLRKSYEEQLLHQANFDTLTSLPNRVLAFDRISQALITYQRDKGHVVIMIIDLDRFKNINDTLGHSAGDNLLINSAERLKSCVRLQDTVARLGGDEFLIILSNIKSEKIIDVIAQKILDSFSTPFHINDKDIYITTSIGITLFPEDGDNPQELLRNADSAMYKAKAGGRNNYCYFTPAMNDLAKARLEIETHLRNALNNREFEIHYQPIIDVHSGRIIAAEALLRWHNKTMGNVPPDAFIPLAEDIGIILPVGNWVLNTACMTAASWISIDKEPLRIAVNVSVRQFTLGDLVGTVEAALMNSGLPANCLEIEVTEGLLLEDAPEVQQTLQKLHEKGVRLSIDDFGTGYSALSYLKKFPFDVLKIDRSFVRDIEENEESATLSKSIISLAHGLNLEVIGEGVETKGQFEFLQNSNIDLIQGYLFSKPVPAVQFEELLTQEYGLDKAISPNTVNVSKKTDIDIGPE